MPSLDQLKATIDEMNRDFPRPGIPPLQLSQLYDNEADEVTAYPGAGQPGVYILIDANMEIAYIGKHRSGTSSVVV